METLCKLDVIIVGCGVSGLSLAYLLGKAGHNVTILEAASTLSEIGAGLILGANASKLLLRWGLKDKLDDMGVKTKSIYLRKFDTGEHLVFMDKETVEEDYGAPQYQLHRADLQTLLCDLVAALPNVKIRVDSRVTSVCPDPPFPHVQLQSGAIVSGDVVLGADGVKSVVRACIVGRPDPPTLIGETVYRTILDAEHFLKDPDLKPFVEEAGISLWAGKGKKVILYGVRAQKQFNLVMTRADTEPGTVPDDAEGIVKLFEGWDPRLRKIQALVKSVIISRLLIRDPLKTWVHPSGLVALIGDAAHPMLPFLAQGACMAIEDAAVFGSLFCRVTSKSQIPALLKAYETIRYDRATAVQQASSAAREGSFQAGGGTTTQDSERLNGDGPSEAGGIGSRSRQEQDNAIFTYDAERAAEEWWSEHGLGIVDISDIQCR